MALSEKTGPNKKPMMDDSVEEGNPLLKPILDDQGVFGDPTDDDEQDDNEKAHGFTAAQVDTSKISSRAKRPRSGRA